LAKSWRWVGCTTADGTRCHQMAGHGEKLGRKQEDAIAALLSQRNIEEAARAAGVGTRTLIRWLKLAEFGKEYRKARREAVHQSIARLQQATGAASTIVLKLLTDPNVPAAVRLRAAECVFDRALKGVELEDIEARLSELERATEESKRGK
jgi:transposase-like protein